MRVAVCIPQVPFERGGAEIFADDLVRALRERGTAVVVFRPGAAETVTWRFDLLVYKD